MARAKAKAQDDPQADAHKAEADTEAIRQMAAATGTPELLRHLTSGPGPDAGDDDGEDT